MPSLIDKLFKSKLQTRNYSPEATDWAAMEALINADKGSGTASSMSMNWMFISAITLLLSLSIYADTQRVESTEAIQESSVSIKSNDNEINGIQNTTLKSNAFKSGITSSPVISDRKSESQSKGKSDQRYNKSEALNNDIHSSSANAISTANSSVPKIDLTEENNRKNDLSLYETDENVRPSKIAVGSSVATAAAQSTIALKTDPSSNSSSGISKNENNSRDKNQEIDAQNDAYYVDQSSHFSSVSNDYYKIKNPNTLEGSSLTLSSSSINSLDDPSNKKGLQSSKRDEAPPFAAYYQKQRRKLPIQFSITAFGELSYITKKITGANEYRSLIKLRNEQEKNIFSGGVGLEVQAKYKQIGFSTGFSLQNWGENVQYEEKYSYEWDITSSTSTDTTYSEEVVFTIDTIYNPNDSTFYIVIDSSLVTVIDSIYTITNYDSTQVSTSLGLADQNGKTTISYWEIPLYFSYQFDLGDFYLSPGLGVTIGFLKITRGYYMAEDLNSLIEMNTNYAVFKKTLINGQINLGLGYKLGDNWSIEATPTYRFNLTNILENPDLIQRYSRFSIQFRLRYYF